MTQIGSSTIDVTNAPALRLSVLWGGPAHQSSVAEIIARFGLHKTISAILTGLRTGNLPSSLNSCRSAVKRTRGRQRQRRCAPPPIDAGDKVATRVKGDGIEGFRHPDVLVARTQYRAGHDMLEPVRSCSFKRPDSPTAKRSSSPESLAKDSASATRRREPSSLGCSNPLKAAHTVGQVAKGIQSHRPILMGIGRA